MRPLSALARDREQSRPEERQGVSCTKKSVLRVRDSHECQDLPVVHVGPTTDKEIKELIDQEPSWLE